ncbi:MAG: hypothetical protein IIB59_01660 [Planctomycetes bacterium]|nr:hypothetical protein [Planctomycetota bacterium]
MLGTTALVGFVHAIVGPDHYLPFVAMARAGDWPLRKTLLITGACGLAHVLASVCVGALGLWLGATVLKLGDLEAFRADLASWALIAFGLLYTVWVCAVQSEIGHMFTFTFTPTERFINTCTCTIKITFTFTNL